MAATPVAFTAKPGAFPHFSLPAFLPPVFHPLRRFGETLARYPHQNQ